MKWTKYIMGPLVFYFIGLKHAPIPTLIITAIIALAIYGLKTLI